MVRLGSNFFDAYNQEISNLRSRRKENMDAFNSFVKMKEENGEKVTASELESYKRSLSNGDFYFAKGLPNSQMITETARRLSESAVQKRNTELANLASTRASTASTLAATKARNIATQTAEMQLAQTLIGQTSGMSEEERKKALPQLFEGAGLDYGAYESRVPSFLSLEQSNLTSTWYTQNNFDKITTQEGLEAALPNAPAWMQNELRRRTEINIKAANNTRVQQALVDLKANLPELARRAQGKKEDLIARIEQDIRTALADRPELIPAALEQAKSLAESSFTLAESDRAATAVKDFASTVTAEDLLATNGDEDKLRQLVTDGLRLQLKGSEPSAADIETAMAGLRARTTSLITKRDAERMVKAKALVNSATFEVLEKLDDEDARDEFLIGVLAEAEFDTESMSAEEMAAQLAILDDILKPRVDIANIEEGQAAQEKFANEVTKVDGPIMKAIQSGQMADQEDTILRLVNAARKNAELSTYSSIEEWKKATDTPYDYAWFEAQAKLAAQGRYIKASTAIQESVSKAVTEEIEGQEDRLKSIGSLLSGKDKEEVKLAILGRILNSYYVPSKDDVAIVAAIDQLVDTQEYTLDEVIIAANTIAKTRGLTTIGSAPMKAVKSALDDANLVEPGTRATVWMGEKVELLNESVDMGVAKIEALPMDATPAEIQAARQASIEGLEVYLEILLGPKDSDGARSGGMLDDPDIRFNLTGLTENSSDIRAQVEAAIAAATRNLTNAEPKGKPNWLVSQGGTGMFFVAPDGREKAIAMGLDPDFLYIRSATGEFLKTDQRAAPVVTGGGVTPEVDLSLAPSVTQVNPASSPLVQDIQGYLGEDQLRQMPRQAAQRIRTGSDGGPAASPAGRFGSYLFGSNEGYAARQYRADLADWLASDAAKDALIRNPASAELLQSNPEEWAIENGWTYNGQ